MMVQPFELDYAYLVNTILTYGEERKGRNGTTKALFGTSLVIDMQNGLFPLLQGRKMFYNGVLGEFAAMIRGPKHIRDFEKWGCNYWKQWAKEDGSIDVDYGNAWLANGQLDRLRETIKTNPTDRRLIINGWRPERLDQLDLPCCHYSYQFYVREGRLLDMIWNQRSADTMIGIPADIILAATWLVVLANDCGLTPGTITMHFGDTHIYEEHIEKAKEYLDIVFANSKTPLAPTTYKLTVPRGTSMMGMRPDWFNITYHSLKPISFELKA